MKGQSSVVVVQNGDFDASLQTLSSELVLQKKTALKKATAFVWFHEKTVGGPATLKQIMEYFARTRIAKPNSSRLQATMLRSHGIHRSAVDKNAYEVDRAVEIGLEKEYGVLIHNDEDIVSSSEVLDESLFIGKRGFLDKLIKQINHCYSNNCFDACAVLMRRVFEVVLILAFEQHGIQDQIRENGGYVTLDRIVTRAVQNTALGLSRPQRDYDNIKGLGNLAVHSVNFNTRKSDIDDIKRTYRVCLEELYYAAGLRT